MKKIFNDIVVFLAVILYYAIWSIFFERVNLIANIIILLIWMLFIAGAIFWSVKTSGIIFSENKDKQNALGEITYVNVVLPFIYAAGTTLILFGLYLFFVSGNGALPILKGFTILGLLLVTVGFLLHRHSS